MLILIFQQTSIAGFNKYLLVEHNDSIVWSKQAKCLGNAILLVFKCMLAYSIMSYKIKSTYELESISG